MNMYIWQCFKCKQFVEKTFVIAKNADAAWTNVQDAVKHHDSTKHDDDSIYDGKVVRLLPALAIKKKTGR